MEHFHQLLNGFCFGSGFILAAVLFKALFNASITGRND